MGRMDRKRTRAGMNMAKTRSEEGWPTGGLISLIGAFYARRENGSWWIGRANATTMSLTQKARRFRFLAASHASSPNVSNMRVWRGAVCGSSVHSPPIRSPRNLQLNQSSHLQDWTKNGLDLSSVAYPALRPLTKRQEPTQYFFDCSALNYC